MRLLSGRARETEIKLSEGFQSGPGADSDLDSTWAKGVKEGGGPGQGSHTLIYFVACQMQLQPEQNKVSIPVRQARAGEQDTYRGQRAEHRGQWEVGSKQHSQDLQALRVIRATCTAATWPGRPGQARCMRRGQHKIVGKVKNLFHNSPLKDFYFRSAPQTRPAPP